MIFTLYVYLIFFTSNSVLEQITSLYVLVEKSNCVPENRTQLTQLNNLAWCFAWLSHTMDGSMLYLNMGLFPRFHSAFHCTCFCWHWKCWFGNRGKRKTVFSVESGRRAIPMLNENDCLRAISMIKAGMLHCAVGMQFSVHINILRLSWRRFQDVGNVKDWCEGPPLRMTPQQDNHFQLVYLRNHFKKSSLTAWTTGLYTISPKTIQNRLHE